MNDTKLIQNDTKFWIDIFPHAKREDNKYTRGHALIYGGAVMTGAARLAARAAQRIGVGLVTLATPSQALPIYAEALESVIVRPSDDENSWGNLLSDPKTNVILIGPGLGIGRECANRVLAVLATQKACVLDADALTNFADKPCEIILQLHSHCVLTPHEGEFERLFGKQIDVYTDKVARAQQAAQLTGSVVLLKGADTIIAAPDGQTIINNNAPPSLATAGAGDVLAGMILGLMAQRMPVFMAAAAAAWLHGKIATDFGPGLIAEDIIAGIPSELKKLFEAGLRCN